LDSHFTESKALPPEKVERGGRKYWQSTSRKKKLMKEKEGAKRERKGLAGIEEERKEKKNRGDGGRLRRGRRNEGRERQEKGRRCKNSVTSLKGRAIDKTQERGEEGPKRYKRTKFKRKGTKQMSLSILRGVGH